MGQQCCTQTILQPLQLQGWTKLEAINGAYIWKNNTTGQTLEQYAFMSNNNQDYDKVIDSFNLRLNHQYLVASKNISNQPQTDLCGCGTTYHGQIFLQRIPIRLSDVNDIPFPDILHVYNQVFKGFKILVPFVGYFVVAQDMICINSQDIVKIWLNANLSKYLPDTMHLKTQAEMVNNIINIIDKNTQKTGLPTNIKQYLVYKKVQTFDQAILAIQQYSRIYNAIIPAKLDCVTEMRFNKQKMIRISKANEVKINVIHAPPKIPAIMNTSYKTARLNSARSTSLIRPSRVVNNVQINRIPHVQQSSLNNSIVKKTPTAIIVNRQSRINNVSPIKRTHVSVSPIKQPLKISNIKIPTKQIINQPIVNQTVLQSDQKRKIQDGHTSQKILEMIRNSRKFSDNVTKTNLNKNITTVSQYNNSQIQSQPKQSDMSAATKDFFYTPEISFEKLKEIASTNNNTFQVIKFNQHNEQSRAFETPRTVPEIIQVTQKNTQNKIGKSNTTSFEFFGFVDVGNTSNISRQKELSEEKVIIKTQTAYQQINKVDEYFSNNTSQIESRIQVPSIYDTISTPIKQSTTLQTTFQSTMTPYQTSQQIQALLSKYDTTSPNYHTSTFTSQFSFQPTYSTTADYNLKTYSSNNYMDIYNISSSYNTYPTSTNYDLNNYGSTSNYYSSLPNTDYLKTTNYGIDTHTNYGLNQYKNYNYGITSNNYDYIDTYKIYGIDDYKSYNNYDTLKTLDYKIDTTFKNYDYQIDTYKNYDYGLKTYSNYDTTLNYTTNSYALDSYKSSNLDTYIVPTYDSSNFKISHYDNIKTTTDNLKQTKFTSNSSNVHQSYTKSSPFPETNFSRNLQSREISTQGFNIQNLAAIYIPIQGYKVTFDNEVLADMSRLRAKTLMQQAILNEQSRLRSKEAI